MLTKSLEEHRRAGPRDIEDVAAYMLENGYVFELNRSFFHPIGHILVVVRDHSGRMFLGLKDCTHNPRLCVFDSSTYKLGQSRWRKWWRSFGIAAHQLRYKVLGFTTQTRPDYREQPKAG